MEEKSPNQSCNELVQFLVPLAEGTLVPDLVNEIHEVVKAVREVRSAGNITLKIEIEPCKGSVHQLVVKGSIASKPPKMPRPMSLYFSDEDGGLHRNDPTQLTFKDFNNEEK